MTTKTQYLKPDKWQQELEFFTENGFKINQPKRGNSIFTILGQGYHCRFINIDNCKMFRLPFSKTKTLLLPGQAARLTLEHYYPFGYQARGGYRYLRKVPPEWLTKKIKGVKGHYIDFVSAYWVIARKLHLDILYPHCLKLKSSLPLNQTLDYLYFWKQARNGLIGLTYSNQQIRWFEENNKRYIKKIYTDNKFFNPCLWCVVNEILHDIAHIAVQCNAYFVATDGYMLPEKKGYKFVQILDRLGLNGYYRHYYGDVEILARGAYKISGYNIHTNQPAEKQTERFSQYKKLEQSNPKNRKFLVKVKIPLSQNFNIRRVQQYHKKKRYQFLLWWLNIPEPSMSQQILNHRKEKIYE